MTLLDLFDRSLVGHGESVGLEYAPPGCSPQCWTFGEIERRSNRWANLLARRGLVHGDRLAVYLSNCVELVELYLACVKLGVLFVPINILYRDWELAHILRDAEPKAMVVADDSFGAYASVV